MLIKAILVGLVLGLCKSEWIYGFPQVGRPIVVSTLTGLFLGDPVQGVIMGSVLELMFIGSFPIGAAVSPDYTSAGAICTAFAILTGGGKAVATAMALPIALLGGFIFHCFKLYDFLIISGTHCLKNHHKNIYGKYNKENDSIKTSKDHM